MAVTGAGPRDATEDVAGLVGGNTGGGGSGTSATRAVFPRSVVVGDADISRPVAAFRPSWLGRVGVAVGSLVRATPELGAGAGLLLATPFESFGVTAAEGAESGTVGD